MIIAVDFDGTCVTHEYPKVGRDVEYCEDTLRKLIEYDNKLILYTMRSHNRKGGSDPLADAIKWFDERSIALWGINKNPEQKEWTESEKIYAQIYIDDAAVGCPLIYKEGTRPYVDWIRVYTLLDMKGCFINVRTKP